MYSNLPGEFPIRKIDIKFILLHGSGDGEAINEKFFRVQLQILKYCGLWNPFEVPYAAKSDRSSSKKYVIFSVAVLASLYYLHTLAQTVFIIKLNDFEVVDTSNIIFYSAH